MTSPTDPSAEPVVRQQDWCEPACTKCGSSMFWRDCYNCDEAEKRCDELNSGPPVLRPSAIPINLTSLAEEYRDG